MVKHGALLLCDVHSNSYLATNTTRTHSSWELFGADELALRAICDFTAATPATPAVLSLNISGSAQRSQTFLDMTEASNTFTGQKAWFSLSRWCHQKV